MSDRRGSIRRALLIFLGAALASVAGGQTITEFPVSGQVLAGIAAGSDGNLWFTQFTLSDNGDTPIFAAIGRMTPAGVLTEFPVPIGSAAVAIAAGPDGNLWMTEQHANRIGRMTTAGVLTEFDVPTPASVLQGITAGPDGNVWFVEANGGKIGRITPSGVVTEFPMSIGAEGIVSGPDGNLWFTETSANKIGRITPSGQITEFPVPTANVLPSFIAAGSDGNLWFTEVQGQNIGRITPAGVVTEFPNGTDAVSPFGIAAGPDGNLWFTGLSNAIGRVTTSGVISAFVLPTPFVQGSAIAAGPDGNLWFTEAGQSAIGRITLGSCGGPTTLCLGGRFLAEATWEGIAPVPPPATAVRMTDDTGYFWFYDATNVEVVVKVINGCAINHHYWVFAAGLTDVLVNLSVQDAQTGTVRQYTNPWGTPFAPVQDTSAFPCP
jgi:streptogramin lyase